MSSMKFLHGACIFYMVSLLSCSSVFAYTKYCSFSELFSNSVLEGVEVGQIGDRKIYTLFTDHLTNESNMVYTILRTHTPVESVGPLNQLIERYQERIASEQSDLQKIIELARSGKIDWIGVELDRTNTSYPENRTKAYLDYLGTLSLFLNSLHGWHPSKTDQLLSLMYPAVIIARAVRSNTFRNIRIHPLEDSYLKIESVDRRRDVHYWEELVKKDPRVTFDQYLAITSLIESTMTFELRLITDSEIEDLLDQLEVAEESRMNMKMFVKAHNDVISVALRRDLAVVQSILDLPDNGLLLFGTAHRNGIQQGLVRAYREGNGSP